MQKHEDFDGDVNSDDYVDKTQIIEVETENGNHCCE